eukprot:c20713_g1_i1.p1 GENE.c20713_g1_i1~~c20713_g1_i1.p1  ORF type:complete len:370 (+),score=111.41 c20713_g1_i1:64-1173(+)
MKTFFILLVGFISLNFVIASNQNQNNDNKNATRIMKRNIYCDLSNLQVTELVEYKYDGEQVFRIGSGITARDVLNHIVNGYPRISYQSIYMTPLMSVDGRISQPVMSVIGAEAGELLFGMNIFEKITGIQLTEMQVASLLSDYVLTLNRPKFNFQIDSFVLENLCRTLKFCMPENRLDNPSPQLISTLRKELIKPENQGCAHFSHLIKNSELFQTRKGLTETFIVSFFNLLWQVPLNRIGRGGMRIIQSKLNLIIFEGAHLERGLVHIKTSDCSPHYIPMMVPEIGKMSLFLQYDDVARFIRLEMIDFLTDAAAKWSIPTNGFSGAFQLMEDISLKQYQTAIQLDQGKTPTFSINWPASCCGMMSEEKQ